MSEVLRVEDLSCEVRLHRSTVHAVSNLDLRLERGETLGLVGESGCGKSMTALAVMGLLPAGGRVVGGSIRFEGRELVGLDEARYREVRGNEIAMVFQDSMSSLNPTKTIGAQIAEPVRLHLSASRPAALERAAEVLALVGIARPQERLEQYPHQLSGGMRQRVLIAMALSCEPKVLIADEPTTALDVTVQAQVLDLLHDLRQRLGMSMLLISHDMGVVAGWTDRVSVMYAGRVVELATRSALFRRMRHPYTQALLASIPRLDQDPAKRLYSIAGQPPDLASPPAGCRFAERCDYADEQCRASEPPTAGNHEHRFACWHPTDGPSEERRRSSPATEANVSAVGVLREASDPVLVVDQVVKQFPLRKEGRRTSSVVHAVSGVSLSVRRGETFGLVGESGCGKSTLARLIVALERPTSGSVVVDGEDLGQLRGRELRLQRRHVQMMFQDPYDALDPRMRVGAILREPFAVQSLGSRREQLDRVRDLLDDVGLPPQALERYPHEFSGGQRQRIGLARVLAANPRVVVVDEPVSALDVSIRSQVLNLMKRMQATHGLTFVVISHDLTIVRYLADRVGVMYLGKLVEVGPNAEVYAHPVHPYTAGLIAAIPAPDPEAQRMNVGLGTIPSEPPSAVDPPSGCRFRTRCALASERCAQEEPLLRSFGTDHLAACHFPLVGEAVVEDGRVVADRR